MNNYVTIYIANGQLDAEMVQGFLEAAGIPTIISQESVGRVFGITSGPLGEVNVLAPEEKMNEALELLASMERGDFVNHQEDIESSADEDNDGED